MSGVFGKSLSGLAVVFGSLFIFFGAQILGVVAIGIVLTFYGWDAERVTSWLGNDTTGQFLTVLFVELFSILGVWLVLKKRKKGFFEQLWISNSKSGLKMWLVCHLFLYLRHSV
jgi:hypothetical protein